MVFQECVYRHWKIVPPDGISEEYHIILINPDIFGQRRSCVGSLFLPCDIRTFLISRWIWHFGLELEYRALDPFVDDFRDNLRIALFYNAHMVVFPRSGEIDYKDMLKDFNKELRKVSSKDVNRDCKKAC